MKLRNISQIRNGKSMDVVAVKSNHKYESNWIINSDSNWIRNDESN